MRHEEREARAPVIVGVGQINDRSDDASAAIDTLGLMKEALERANADAGGGFLREVQSLGIVEQMSWPVAHWPGEEKITPYLLAALGISPSRVELTPEPSGESPVRLLNDAANRIAAGEVGIAAIVGAEALRTAARRAAAGAAGPRLDLIREVTERRAGELRRRYGLLTPTDVYPLYENACRAAWGQTLEEAQLESATIWAGMSAAAADNPDAWIRRRYTVQELLAPSAENRLISFPYTKMMVANSNVNQGAAVILTGFARARAMGVPEDRMIYVGPGAAAHEAEDFLARDRFDSSAALAVSIRRALELNELSSADLEVVELYSCFPCVPKMARRILGWPLERRHSVYGGLTFGGGPIGNCMTHAVAAMTQHLRRRRGRGLIVANGGFATHNHAIVLGAEPAPPSSLPRSYDYQADADALRAPAPPLLEEHVGAGSVETYSVPYDRSGRPAHATVVARTPDGRRFLAHVPAEDASTLGCLVDGRREPIGREGRALPGANGRVEWKFT